MKVFDNLLNRQFGLLRPRDLPQCSWVVLFLSYGLISCREQIVNDLIIRQDLKAVFAFTMIYIWAQPLLFSITDGELFKSWLINSSCPNKINTKVYLFTLLDLMLTAHKK